MTTRWFTCFVALGSNLNEPQAQVECALTALAALPNTRLVRHSSLYRNPPMGGLAQPDYINAVAMLSTQLSPLDMLHQLQQLELQQGRQRSEQQWAARILDLDLVLYEDQQYQSPELTLPHPGLQHRAFVLYPLYECVPDLILPDGQALATLVQYCPATDLHRL